MGLDGEEVKAFGAEGSELVKQVMGLFSSVCIYRIYTMLFQLLGQ